MAVVLPEVPGTDLPACRLSLPGPYLPRSVDRPPLACHYPLWVVPLAQPVKGCQSDDILSWYASTKRSPVTQGIQSTSACVCTSRCWVSTRGSHSAGSGVAGGGAKMAEGDKAYLPGSRNATALFPALITNTVR